MDEPLGYYIFNGSKRVWLTDDHGGGDWSTSYYDAFEFTDLDEVNREMLKADKKSGDTFYVFALMPSPGNQT